MKEIKKLIKLTWKVHKETFRSDDNSLYLDRLIDLHKCMNLSKIREWYIQDLWILVYINFSYKTSKQVVHDRHIDVFRVKYTLRYKNIRSTDECIKEEKGRVGWMDR